MEDKLIQILVQGGAVGICLALIYVVYRMQNGQRTEFMEELKASRNANAEQGRLNRAAIEKMADGAKQQAIALGKLTTRIKTLPADRRLSKRDKRN